MTIQEAIISRHSVRQYIEKPIEEEKISQLRELIEECNRAGSLHIQLVTDEPKAFSNGLAKYGKFTGISNYIVMACKKGDETTLGYYGEHIVLVAQTLGLNTCWVGLTSVTKRTPTHFCQMNDWLVLLRLATGPHKARNTRRRRV